MQLQGGKEFSADLRYSWKCSQDRNIRVRDAQGAIQEVEGTKGCNTAYYQEDVPKAADGTTPYEITCQCGALIRAFANVDNIRS
jgi:expansin (peptidoglycan-binding protein)